MDKGGYAYISTKVNLATGTEFSYVSGGGSLSGVTWAYGTFFKTSNNLWGVHLYARFTVSSTARTGLTLSCANLVFEKHQSAISYFPQAGEQICAVSGNNIVWLHTSKTATVYEIAGTFYLTTKPTAYLPDGV